MRSSAHFEMLITDMHRAINCARGLRRKTSKPDYIKDFFGTKPDFVTDKVADRIRNMRNAIQHLDNEIINGTLAEGASHAIVASGNEVPKPDEPGQSIKTINRLEIADCKITFRELRDWLSEMGRLAALINSNGVKSSSAP